MPRLRMAAYLDTIMQGMARARHIDIAIDDDFGVALYLR